MSSFFLYTARIWIFRDLQCNLFLRMKTSPEATKQDSLFRKQMKVTVIITQSQAMMYYENNILEWPKQLEVSGKGKNCCIQVCKNAQCGKDR